jgi:hypothetical protein
MATIAGLRSALAEYFGTAETRTAMLRLREAGLLPVGAHGRCGSAEVTYRQAVIALLALASDAHPKNAPAEAERIGSFRLLRHDENPGGGQPTKRTPYENQHVDLLTVLALEIERFDDDHMPSSWNIASNGVCQAAPDRLLFGDSLEDVTDPADVDRIVRQTRIPARLLADIAELFHARCAEAA